MITEIERYIIYKNIADKFWKTKTIISHGLQKQVIKATIGEDIAIAALDIISTYLYISLNELQKKQLKP